MALSTSSPTFAVATVGSTQTEHCRVRDDSRLPLGGKNTAVSAKLRVKVVWAKLHPLPMHSKSNCAKYTVVPLSLHGMDELVGTTPEQLYSVTTDVNRYLSRVVPTARQTIVKFSSCTFGEPEPELSPIRVALEISPNWLGVDVFPRSLACTCGHSCCALVGQNTVRISRNIAASIFLA